MPDLVTNIVEPIGGFQMQGMMMRYNLFVPRLYNWCKSLGFEAGKIMPSRAFCSDENQGYPIIMIAKHFGSFPFNHGRVGGIVATDRHGPHAEHGQQLVIIQASHVGYDPETKLFGTYRRLQTDNQTCSTSCGKIQRILDWYQHEVQFAQQNIRLQNIEGENCIIVDNQLLHEDRDEGLFLRLPKLINTDSEGQCIPLKILSTAKIFTASSELVKKIDVARSKNNQPQILGKDLTSDMFYFRRNISRQEEGAHHLESNLIRYMPQIITSASPIVTAAQINTQIEFDRTFRSIAKEDSYHGKKVLFISGLNIDISPRTDQSFPLTKFVPWAAHLQEQDGTQTTIEQRELVDALEKQSIDNPDQIDLEVAIQTMTEAEEVKIEL